MISYTSKIKIMAADGGLARVLSKQSFDPDNCKYGRFHLIHYLFKHLLNVVAKILR